MVVRWPKAVDAFFERLEANAKVEPRLKCDNGVKPFSIAINVEARTSCVRVDEEDHVSVLQNAMGTSQLKRGAVPNESVEFRRQHSGMTR